MRAWVAALLCQVIRVIRGRNCGDYGHSPVSTKERGPRRRPGLGVVPLYLYMMQTGAKHCAQNASEQRKVSSVRHPARRAHSLPVSCILRRHVLRREDGRFYSTSSRTRTCFMSL
jgi:hypothetical protein